MILALAAALLLQADPQDKGVPVPFKVIDSHPLSGFQAPQEAFLTTLDEWVALWARRQANVDKKKPHPPVDFTKDAVVVVALGQKPSSGYAVEITRIVKTKEEIQIFLKKTAPGPRTLPSGTSPFVLAKIPKPDRFVRFYEEEKK